MTGSVNSSDLLGSGLGRLALAISVLAAVALVVPFGLTSIGFGAILGVAVGLQAVSVESVSGQPPVSRGELTAPVPPRLSPATDSNLPSAAEILARARSWLGTRYVFGGCSSSGVDCSCFVQTIFHSVGIGLPRTSQLQYNATVGRGLATTSPEPGDLVFFFHTYFDAGQDWTHVGVVSRIDSNGTVWMIDAPGARAAGDPPDAPFGQVREEPIAGSWLQHRPTYARNPAT
jgi:cell wall-associated NlpC family hydrolase